MGACVKGGTKYGDTCWGVIPKSSSHRLCGCNSGGWEGYGIYYGGYKQNNDGCDGQGGGFAGPKKEQPAERKLALGWIDHQNPSFVITSYYQPFPNWWFDSFWCFCFF